MMDIALLNRDLEIVNGDFVLCRDESQAIAQAISIRLRTLAGEWFLDMRAGLPYLSQILGKKCDHTRLRTLITRELKSLPTAITINNFTVEPGRDERSIAVSFNAVLSDRRSIEIKEAIGV